MLLHITFRGRIVASSPSTLAPKQELVVSEHQAIVEFVATFGTALPPNSVLSLPDMSDKQDQVDNVVGR
jgi:hypothetical protein